jgi:hypothetical protein
MSELFEIDKVGLVGWEYKTFVNRQLDLHMVRIGQYEDFLRLNPKKFRPHINKILQSLERRYGPKTVASTGQIYVLRLTSQDEKFLKVGIASNIDNRIKHLDRETNRHYTIEKMLVSCKMNWTWLNVLESLALSDFHMLRENPVKIFSGRTECLVEEPNTLTGLKAIIGIGIKTLQRRGFTVDSPLYISAEMGYLLYTSEDLSYDQLDL